MNVLFISVVFPRFHAPGGSPTRVYCLIRELAKNHQITLLTTRWPGVEIEPSSLDGICEVIFYPFCEKPSVQERKVANFIGRKNWDRAKALKHLLFEYPQTVQGTLRHLPNFQKKLSEINLEKFDLVQIEVSKIAYRAAEVKKNQPEIPIVLDLHDVDSLIEYRNFKNASGFRWKTFTFFEWRKMVRYERKVSKLFDKCLTVSEEDKNLLLSISPNTDVTVIPNGVDTDFFRSKNPDNWEPKSIFFVSSNWSPNEDAVLFFHKDIFPLIKREIPDVKFYIIGGLGKNERIKSLSDENTIVTGYVDDVRSWMERSAIGIIPMRLGGGTKLKTLEALSIGKAVVSTSEGCEGIEVTDGENILIADTPEDFAKAVITLLQDAALCRRLGDNGRKLVEKTYDWKIIGNRLEGVYNEISQEWLKSTLESH